MLTKIYKNHIFPIFLLFKFLGCDTVPRRGYRTCAVEKPKCVCGVQRPTAGLV
jgi:hypothetical protein